MTAANPHSAARRRALGRMAGLAAGLVLAGAGTAAAQGRGGEDSMPESFRPGEIIDNGHRFFGSVSRGLALTVEEATRRWGQPNGYILGQEASGAIVGGVRYGEGTLYTRNQGDYPLFWQGPSIGFDVGGDGSKVMMLVYNLNSTNDMFHRFPGVDGSAYVVGGLGMTVMKAGNVVVIPIRSGLGLRAGVNVGYLKFTNEPTWNPF